MLVALAFVQATVAMLTRGVSAAGPLRGAESVRSSSMVRIASVHSFIHVPQCPCTPASGPQQKRHFGGKGNCKGKGKGKKAHSDPYWLSSGSAPKRSRRDSDASFLKEMAALKAAFGGAA